MFPRAGVFHVSSLMQRSNAGSSHVQLLRRFYRPWINRTPLKVKLPDGTVLDRREEARKAFVRDKGKDPVFSQLHNELENEENVRREEAGPRRSKQGKLPGRIENVEDAGSLHERSLGVEKVLPSFEYTKLTQNDSIFRNMMMLAKKKKNRRMKQGTPRREQKFIVEGTRLVREALQAGLMPDAIFFARDSELTSCFAGQCPPAFVESLKDKIYKAPFETMQLWSEVKTSPGILGVFNMASLDAALAEIEGCEAVKPITVVMDNVRDPGNMGSMLRTAAAAGCRQAFLTRGCVDPWDSKVIRGGMGAHFRLPLHQDVQWDDLRPLLPRDSSVFVADSEGADSVSYSSILPSGSMRINHVVLVVGGETEGLSGQAYRLLDEFHDCRRVHVPLARGVDSLNVAAAFSVLVFHISSVLDAKGTG